MHNIPHSPFSPSRIIWLPMIYLNNGRCFIGSMSWQSCSRGSPTSCGGGGYIHPYSWCCLHPSYLILLPFFYHPFISFSYFQCISSYWRSLDVHSRPQLQGSQIGGRMEGRRRWCPRSQYERLEICGGAMLWVRLWTMHIGLPGCFGDSSWKSEENLPLTQRWGLSQQPRFDVAPMVATHAKSYNGLWGQTHHP